MYIRTDVMFALFLWTRKKDQSLGKGFKNLLVEKKKLQILRYQVLIMRDQNRKNQTKKDLNQESTTESSESLHAISLLYPSPSVCKECHCDLKIVDDKRPRCQPENFLH